MKKLINIGMLGFVLAAFSVPATAFAEDEADLAKEDAAAEQEEQAESSEAAADEKEIEAAEAEEESVAVEEVKVEEAADTTRADECNKAIAKCTDAQGPFKEARKQCEQLRKCVHKCKATQRLYKGQGKAKARKTRKFKGSPKCLRAAANKRKSCVENANKTRKTCSAQCRKGPGGILKKAKCIKSCNRKAKRSRATCRKQFNTATKRCSRSPMCRTLCQKLYKSGKCGEKRKLFFQKAKRCAGAARACKGVTFTGNEKDAE